MVDRDILSDMATTHLVSFFFFQLSPYLDSDSRTASNAQLYPLTRKDLLLDLSHLRFPSPERYAGVPLREEFVLSVMIISCYRRQRAEHFGTLPSTRVPTRCYCYYATIWFPIIQLLS